MSLRIWRAGEMPTAECAACGHYLGEHKDDAWHCQVDILGLFSNEWRRCTCTFVRVETGATP